MANRDLLQSGKISTTAAMLLLIDTYGTEALQWDLETIKMELEDDYRIKLTGDIIDKLAVGIQLITTNKFYTSLPEFINICNVMNDEQGLPNVWDPADAEEIACSMVEVSLLDPPEDGDWLKAFTPEIIGYIVVVLREAGVTTAPSSLKFIPSEMLLGPDIGALSTDPEIYAAAYQEATEASGFLENEVNGFTYDLIDELKQLQLRNGNLNQVLEELEKTITPPVPLIA